MPSGRLPSPWKCRRCQGLHVFIVKIDYEAEIKCGGCLHKFTVHNLKIPICGWCGEKVFTEKVDEQIQARLHVHLLSITKCHLEFNIKGCQSSRFCGTGEPNISGIRKGDN